MRAIRSSESVRATPSTGKFLIKSDTQNGTINLVLAGAWVLFKRRDTPDTDAERKWSEVARINFRPCGTNRRLSSHQRIGQTLRELKPLYVVTVKKVLITTSWKLERSRDKTKFLVRANPVIMIHDTLAFLSLFPSFSSFSHFTSRAIPPSSSVNPHRSSRCHFAKPLRTSAGASIRVARARNVARNYITPSLV